MIVSFLLSVHAVELAAGVFASWRGKGFTWAGGVLYSALVVAHLLFHHQIPNGPIDRFFDVAILALGTVLVAQIFLTRHRLASLRA